MKIFLALVLCLVIPTTAFAADNSYTVIYDGGSLQNIKSGTKSQLFVEPTKVRIVHDKEAGEHSGVCDHRDYVWTGCSPENRDSDRTRGDLAGRGRVDGVLEIEEALHRDDVGRRGQGGRLCDAVRQERVSRNTVGA